MNPCSPKKTSRPCKTPSAVAGSHRPASTSTNLKALGPPTAACAMASPSRMAPPPCRSRSRPLGSVRAMKSSCPPSPSSRAPRPWCALAASRCWWTATQWTGACAWIRSPQRSRRAPRRSWSCTCTAIRWTWTPSWRWPPSTAWPSSKTPPRCMARSIKVAEARPARLGKSAAASATSPRSASSLTSPCRGTPAARACRGRRGASQRRVP